MLNTFIYSMSFLRQLPVESIKFLSNKWFKDFNWISQTFRKVVDTFKTLKQNFTSCTWLTFVKMQPSLSPVSYWWNTIVTAFNSSSVRGARNTLCFLEWVSKASMVDILLGLVFCRTVRGVLVRRSVCIGHKKPSKEEVFRVDFRC